MVTPTRYREIEIGDGDYAAVENNKRNAQRGTFVVEGGEMTPGTSSAEIAINIDATEFRADETDYNLNDGQVTLTSNGTAYPRRDLVIAEGPQTDGGTPSYRVLEGETIGSEVMQSLVADGRVREDGEPIYPVMALPQVQPPPAHGLLGEATVLGMWYVPPRTADATDMVDSYYTDLRLSGIGVEDVLRPGDALAEVESGGGVLDANAQNGSTFQVDIEKQTIPANSSAEVLIIPGPTPVSIQSHYYRTFSQNAGTINQPTNDGDVFAEVRANNGRQVTTGNANGGKAYVHPPDSHGQLAVGENATFKIVNGTDNDIIASGACQYQQLPEDN